MSKQPITPEEARACITEMDAGRILYSSTQYYLNGKP